MWGAKRVPETLSVIFTASSIKTDTSESHEKQYTVETIYSNTPRIKTFELNVP